MFFNKSDSKPNLNKDEDLYYEQIQKILQPKQQKKKEKIVIHKHM